MGSSSTRDWTPVPCTGGQIHIHCTIREVPCLSEQPPPSAVVKNWPISARDARDLASIPGLGRSPGEGNGNPLHCSCLDNPMDGGARWATVHGVTKSQTRLSTKTCGTCFSGRSLPVFFWCLPRPYPGWVLQRSESTRSKTGLPVSTLLTFCFYIFGCALRLAGSQFPDQGLNPCHL